MPELQVHEEKSLKMYGKKFTELHQWMDAPVKINGPQHRKYRHDPNFTPEETKRLFGIDADNACLDHIIQDMEEIEKKLGYSPKITGKSTILNIRLPNQLYKNLIELSLFMDTTKSDIVKTMIYEGMIEVVNMAIYKKFEGEIEIDTKAFFAKRTDFNSIKDEPTLILKRDKGICRVCSSNERVGIFHIDGNIGNFSPFNLILLCDDCLHKFQRHMLKYSTKTKFAIWYISEKEKQANTK